MKNKKILTIFIILMSVLILTTYKVQADSGWDTSYDSGGSSWDSGSSSSSDYYGSSGDAGEMTPLTALGLFIFFCIWCGLIVYCIKGTHSSKKFLSKTYSSLSEDTIKDKLNMDREELNELAFDIYKNIQNAWSEFNYKELEKYTTDELYNSYKMQLEALELKKQKNIMTEIENLETKIYNYTASNDILSIYVYMNVRMYDYVIDKDGKVVRGTDKKKVNIEYEIVLVKALKNEKDVCPNCGAKINTKTSRKCNYCNSVLVQNKNEFVMSKKKNINQRME